MAACIVRRRGAWAVEQCSPLHILRSWPTVTTRARGATQTSRALVALLALNSLLAGLVPWTGPLCLVGSASEAVSPPPLPVRPVESKCGAGESMCLEGTGVRRLADEICNRDRHGLVAATRCAVDRAGGCSPSNTRLADFDACRARFESCCAAFREFSKISRGRLPPQSTFHVAAAVSCVRVDYMEH